MTEKIYLAIPYTHSDPWVREYRFNVANFVGARLINEGSLVYSPITQTRGMEKHGLPTDWDFWQKMCTEFVAWADVLHVVCVRGWDISVGVTEEIRIAKELRKRIFLDHMSPRVFENAS